MYPLRVSGFLYFINVYLLFYCPLYRTLKSIVKAEQEDFQGKYSATLTMNNEKYNTKGFDGVYSPVKA